MLARRLALAPFIFGATTLALLLFSTTTPAQQEPAQQPPGAKQSQSTAVVVADVSDDETENAKLRAKIYESFRERGLSPDSKADVPRAAEAAGAMQEGRVSSEDGPLESLRKGLGAAVLVRVTRDPSGVRVIVVREGGVKRKVVASAAEVPGAVAEMLGAKAAPGSAAPAPPAAPREPKGDKAEPATGSQAGLPGFILPARVQPDKDMTDPKVLAAAWEKRGGVRASYGVHAQVTALLIPETPFVGKNPITGEQDLGRARSWGVGGGLGLDLSMLYLPLPDKRGGSTSWPAFRLGLRLDVNGLYVRPPEKYKYTLDASKTQVVSKDTVYDNVAYIYGVLPIQLGVHYGFGDYRLPTLWRGFALGLAYSPAWIVSLKVGEKENATDSHFNYAGFELSLDVTKLEAEAASQPQIRFTALVLPRVSDDLPWLASLGVGAIWY